MNNAQIKNIIRFSFNFHQSMGSPMHDFDPGYILEKWSKYFGDAKPKDMPASRRIDHGQYDHEMDRPMGNRLV